MRYLWTERPNAPKTTPFDAYPLSLIKLTFLFNNSCGCRSGIYALLRSPVLHSDVGGSNRT